MAVNLRLDPLVDPGPELSASDRERFARHLPIPELGEVAQRRLRAAKVCVVGAGGLGSPALLYLAAAGVGTLGIVDADTVELVNLQRQVLHATEGVGVAKASSAAARLAELDPDVRVVPHIGPAHRRQRGRDPRRLRPGGGRRRQLPHPLRHLRRPAPTSVSRWCGAPCSSPGRR